MWGCSFIALPRASYKRDSPIPTREPSSSSASTPTAARLHQMKTTLAERITVDREHLLDVESLTLFTDSARISTGIRKALATMGLRHPTRRVYRHVQSLGDIRGVLRLL